MPPFYPSSSVTGDLRQLATVVTKFALNSTLAIYIKVFNNPSLRAIAKQSRSELLFENRSGLLHFVRKDDTFIPLCKNG